MSVNNPSAIANVSEMYEFAVGVVKQLHPGDVLLLSGPLGAGKTTFVQALAKALGVEGKVASPSYTIAAEYEVKNHPMIQRLVHMDLYRLAVEGAANDVAVRAVLEEIGEPGRLTVIEWAERLGELTPAGRWLRFEHGETENERLVDFE